MESSGSGEKPRSFDPLASVDLYRFDLMTYGRILPETRQRVYDEELSFLAEGINRPLCTEFVLQQNEDGELVYFDQGQWRPYVGTLIRGLDIAKCEAMLDPRRRFLHERAETDLLIGYQLASLKPGEVHKWYSPFPEEELYMYGAMFIGECGFQVQRRMGFLYYAKRLEDGTLLLQSHSVDNSDHNAYVAAMRQGDLSSMLHAYDEVMIQQYGGTFNAGRRQNQHVPEENAWDIVTSQKDLLQYYFSEIEHLAQQSVTDENTLERQKKQLMYGVWAALKSRLDRNVLHLQATPETVWRGSMAQQHERLEREVLRACQEFARRGEVLVGCGGKIIGSEDLLDTDPGEVRDAIFSSKFQTEDRYGSLTFVCQKGHVNTRPRNQLIGKCRICNINVGCGNQEEKHERRRPNLSRTHRGKVAGILLRQLRPLPN